MFNLEPPTRLVHIGLGCGPGRDRKVGRYLLFALAFIFTAGCATAFSPNSGPAEDTNQDTDAYSDSDTELYPATDSEDTGTPTDEFDTTDNDSEIDSEPDMDTQPSIDTQIGTDSDPGSSTDSEVDTDACPEDDNKTEAGICGCGVPDSDTDSDGTMDCHDDCPDDPNKTEPGDCGCHVAEGSCDLLDCANGTGRFDKNTNLCWQQHLENETLTWPLAVTYCDNLVLGGHGDWVLPSRQDFMDLLGNCDADLLGGVSGYCDTCADSALCGELFESGAEWHWTSSTWDHDSMWRANFITGRIGHVRDYNELNIRCVRSGP